MPTPLDMLRDLIKSLAQKKDAEAIGEHVGSQGIIPLPNHIIDPGILDVEGEQVQLPHVTRAPQFRPSIDVRGGQPFSRAIDALLNQVPEFRGRSSVIQHGPTRGVIDELVRSKLSPLRYDETNLLGLYDHNSREVSINPRLGSLGEQGFEYKNHPVIAHELGHSVGAKDHSHEMEEIEGSIQQMYPNLNFPYGSTNARRRQ